MPTMPVTAEGSRTGGVPHRARLAASTPAMPTSCWLTEASARATHASYAACVRGGAAFAMVTSVPSPRMTSLNRRCVVMAVRLQLSNPLADQVDHLVAVFPGGLGAGQGDDAAVRGGPLHEGVGAGEREGARRALGLGARVQHQLDAARRMQLEGGEVVRQPEARGGPLDLLADAWGDAEDGLAQQLDAVLARVVERGHQGVDLAGRRAGRAGRRRGGHGRGSASG